MYRPNFQEKSLCINYISCFYLFLVRTINADALQDIVQNFWDAFSYSDSKIDKEGHTEKIVIEKILEYIYPTGN